MSGWGWLPLALFGLALTTWSGTCVSAALWPPLLREPRLVRAALGYGVGAGLLSLAMFALAWSSIGLSLAPIVVGQVALALAAALGRGWRRALVVAWPFRRGARRPPPGVPATVLGGAILLVVVGVGLLSLKEGASFVDARTVWMLKSRVFFLDRGFDGVFFGDWPDLAERRTYPILVPLLGSYLLFWVGECRDAALKLGQLGFLVALLVLVGRALAPHVGRTFTLAAVLLLALCGQTMSVAIWGGADLQLACYLLAAAWLTLRTPPGGRPVGLVALLLAAATFTKSEGAAAAFCFVVAVTFGDSGSWPRRLRAAVGLVLPSLLVFLAWQRFCASLEFNDYLLRSGRLTAVLADPSLLGDRIRWVAIGFATESVSPRWMFAWPLFLIAVVRGPHRRPLVILPLVVGLQLAVYAGTYVLLTQDIHWAMRVSVGRIMYHVFPVAYVYALLRLAPSTETTR